MAHETIQEVCPILIDPDQPHFIKTHLVENLVDRVLVYAEAGLPVHLTGPTGTGKTTLAMYAAAKLGQPVVLIHGDEEYGSAELVGGVHGFQRKKTVDNFIHSVLKTEESMSSTWVDNRITVACKHGFTLIYDEFTRSRPEANNVLLSILEERVLDLPAERGGETYMRVHPSFTAIFTSNPEEYAGVHKAQDALKDRMITVRLGYYDRDTEIAITAQKSGLSGEDAARVVDIIGGIRDDSLPWTDPSLRASIMISKVLAAYDKRPAPGDDVFVQSCMDVLCAKENGGMGVGEEEKLRSEIERLIGKYC